MPDLAILRDYLPIILPLVLLQIILLIVALTHLLRHPHVKRGSKKMWTFIIIFVNIIGPVAYFLWGRSEE